MNDIESVVPEIKQVAQLEISIRNVRTGFMCSITVFPEQLKKIWEEVRPGTTIDNMFQQAMAGK